MTTSRIAIIGTGKSVDNHLSAIRKLGERVQLVAAVDIDEARVKSVCAEHGIRYEDVERVEAVVNWLETQYPSPAFPSRREDLEARRGGTAYFTAYGVTATPTTFLVGRDRVIRWTLVNGPGEPRDFSELPREVAALAS